MRPELNTIHTDSTTQTDSAISRAVWISLDWDFFVPDGWIQATVLDGVVRLQGRVEFQGDWAAIRRALSKIRGVREVHVPDEFSIEHSPALVRR